MKLATLFLTLALCWPSVVSAGTIREWTNTEGRKLKAELVKHDVEKGAVTLKNAKGRSYTLKVSTLSEADQKWLTDLQARLQAWESKKDKMETIKFPGQSFMRGRVYYPKNLPVDSPPALIVLFGAGGDGSGMVLQLEKELRAAGLMAIGASGFSKSLKPNQRKARFDAVMDYIDANLPHSKIYLGGFSDGVARCIELASYKNEVPWAGVLASTGKLDEGQNLNGLPDGLRMVVTVGNYDKTNASQVAEDSKALTKAGCVVSKMSFAGGNQLPLGDDMEKVMKQLLQAR